MQKAFRLGKVNGESRVGVTAARRKDMKRYFLSGTNNHSLEKHEYRNDDFILSPNHT